MECEELGDSLTIEYINREQEYRYIDMISQITNNTSYLQLHVETAYNLSQMTDLSIIYFLICPLKLYSETYKRFIPINFDDIICFDGINEYDSTLMLGSDNLTMIEILINIEQLILRLRDPDILKQLQFVGTVLSRLQHPHAYLTDLHTVEDIRVLLIRVSDCSSVLQQYI